MIGLGEFIIGFLWFAGGALILYGVHEIAGNDAAIVAFGILILKTIDVALREF